ncbi:MAG: alanine--tRNA ligase, partial [Alphaproteobacteria bacterium]|nr:alanine--tRNA ligase [Alphaproteobacteria bacterium]
LKAAPADLPQRVVSLLEDRKRLERELSEARRALATGGGGGPEVETIAGVPATLRRLDGVPARDLKPMIDDLKRKLGSAVIALMAIEDGKASVVVGVTDDLKAKIDAVTLVRAAVGALGGKGGGGRPDMAQGGGPDGANATAALDAIRAAIAQRAA